MSPPQLRGRLPAPVTPLVRLWRTTYAPDYVGILVLIGMTILVTLIIKPFHRLFYINDMRINFPFAEHERVPDSLNYIYSAAIPLAALVATNLIMRAPAGKHEVTYLCFLISLLLSTFLTHTVKNAVGRPRPDLVDRCQPRSSTPASKLVDISVCTTPDGWILQEGWRSFPSGHSSFAFSGLGFLSLFWAGQLHLFRHAAGGRDLSRALLCLVPLIGAALIAISRCEDYRHDVEDVCVGSALGFAVAFWSYRRHWPALSSSRCDEPYPKPGIDTQPGWQRVRDEEEGGGQDRDDIVGQVGYDMDRIE